MSCQECKARCFPENPSQPFYIGNKYLPPLCRCCTQLEDPLVKELNNLKEEVERLKKKGLPYFVVQVPAKMKKPLKTELKAIES